MNREGPNLMDSGSKKSGRIMLPVVSGERGDLAYIEETRHIPFAIKRVYYIYNIPKGARRGNHAHRTSEQLIIAARGSFDVILDDGRNRETFRMDRPDHGLYVPVMLWNELENFSSDAFCLVLASQDFDENEYIRDYYAFQRVRTGSNDPRC